MRNSCSFAAGPKGRCMTWKNFELCGKVHETALGDQHRIIATLNLGMMKSQTDLG